MTASDTEPLPLLFIAKALDLKGERSPWKGLYIFLYCVYMSYMNCSLPTTGVLGIDTVLGSIAPIRDDFVPDAPSGIATGLPQLDRLTGGFQAGELVILAAKQGVGKTSLATTMAQHASINRRIPAFLAFFDTSFEDYGQRFLAAQARVDIERIITGSLTPADIPLLEAAHETLRGAPITFFSGQNVSVDDLKSHISVWCDEHKSRPALVVVDTLQFIQARQNTPADERAKDILRGLKCVAEERSLVIVATSQVNPNTSGLEPTVHDLLWADAISSIGDVVVLLSGDSEVRQIRVVKKRSDEAGSHLLFKSEWTRFLTPPPEVSIENAA